MTNEQNNQIQSISAINNKIKYLIIIIIILSIIIGLFGIYIANLLQKQKNDIVSTPVNSQLTPTQNILPSQNPTVLPNMPIPTKSSSNIMQFTQIMQKIIPIIENAEFQKLAEIQPEQENICDDALPYQSNICNNQPNGTKISGLVIGREASEGNIFSKEEFIQTLNNYVHEHGKFTFGSSRIYGDSGSILLYSNDKKWELGVVLTRNNKTNQWEIQYTLIGVNLNYY